MYLQASIHAQEVGMVIQVLLLVRATDDLRLIKGQVHLQLQALPAPQVHLVGQPTVLGRQGRMRQTITPMGSEAHIFWIRGPDCRFASSLRISQGKAARVS